MRKRLALLVCALAMLTGLVGITGTASAGGRGSVATCLGKTLLDQNIVGPASLPWGVVNLCVDGDHYFAQYIHWDANRRQAPMPSGFFGNAWLYRYLDGGYVSRHSCDDPGGNGHVVPGETWCVTPRIYAPNARVTFAGAAFVYQSINDEWRLRVSGWTARCNKHICYGE